MVNPTRKPLSKLLFLMIMLLISTVSITACGAKTDDTANSTAPAADHAVKDPFGHEVKIPANPQRIIGTYLEDPLVSLGVKPVAQWSVDNGIQDYLKSQLDAVPTIPYNLPLEKVMSFNPDLILVGSETLVQNGLYDQYAKIAPTYVLGDAIAQDWRKTLLKLGERLNKSSQAEQVLKDYDQKAKETKEKLQKIAKDKSVAILWLTQKQFNLVNGNVASGAVLYGDLGLKMPNIASAIPDAKAANWNPISLEKLAELNANYIFLVNSDKGQKDTLNSPIWRELPAVKAGHVYEMSSTSSWLYNGAIAGTQTMDDVVKSLVP